MLTLKETSEIAKLAKLSLSDKEIERLRKQLSETLGYVEVLKELDTTSARPTAQVTGLNNVFCGLTQEALDHIEALTNAKRKKDSLFETDAVF